MRLLFPVFTALTLSACTAGQDVQLESRNIQLEENAVPASTGPDATALTKLVRASGPSYVTLTVSKVDKQGSLPTREGNGEVAITSGSGFVVDPAGLIMTAGHVAVQKGYAVSARAANGRVYTGTVVGVRPENDMALIKLKGYAGKAVTPAASQCLASGSLVYSLGKPRAQGDTARVGSLQSMHFGRPVTYGKFGYPDAMVLRMGTQKGESGGPLFNQSGELVGMVVSTLTDTGGNLLNMAHAVPAPALAEFLCSNVQCTAQWAQMAQRSTSSCPNS